MRGRRDWRRCGQCRTRLISGFNHWQKMPSSEISTTEACAISNQSRGRTFLASARSWIISSGFTKTCTTRSWKDILIRECGADSKRRCATSSLIPVPRLGGALVRIGSAVSFSNSSTGWHAPQPRPQCIVNANRTTCRASEVRHGESVLWRIGHELIVVTW